jgi:hypothetical protein
MVMHEDPHVYREVSPDEALYDFEVGTTGPERLRFKVQRQLVEALRQAGVLVIFPTSGKGELLMEEEGLRKALNVYDDEAFEACLEQTTERVELRTGALCHTFWTEADLLRSGLLWAGESAIQDQIFRTLSEALVPVAGYQVMKHRNVPGDTPIGSLSALEEMELFAITEQMMNAILPGCEGMIIGGDGIEQGELFEEEGTA